jgi:hypothetical protein
MKVRAAAMRVEFFGDLDEVRRRTLSVQRRQRSYIHKDDEHVPDQVNRFQWWSVFLAKLRPFVERGPHCSAPEPKPRRRAFF